MITVNLKTNFVVPSQDELTDIAFLSKEYINYLFEIERRRNIMEGLRNLFQGRNSPISK